MTCEVEKRLSSVSQNLYVALATPLGRARPVLPPRRLPVPRRGRTAADAQLNRSPGGTSDGTAGTGGSTECAAGGDITGGNSGTPGDGASGASSGSGSSGSTDTSGTSGSASSDTGGVLYATNRRRAPRIRGSSMTVRRQPVPGVPGAGRTWVTGLLSPADRSHAPGRGPTTHLRYVTRPGGATRGFLPMPPLAGTGTRINEAVRSPVTRRTGETGPERGCGRTAFPRVTPGRGTAPAASWRVPCPACPGHRCSG